MRKFAHAASTDGSVILSDGYCSYIPALENYTHEYHPYGPDSGLLHWLHIVISNTKAFILGIYRENRLTSKVPKNCAAVNKDRTILYVAGQVVNCTTVFKERVRWHRAKNMCLN